MNDGNFSFLALGLVLGLLMVFLHAFKRAVPEGLGNPWAWVAAAFVTVLLAGRATGLLAALGIDPHAALMWVLVGGVVLAMLVDFKDRIDLRP
jgi:hypothetical protein